MDQISGRTTEEIKKWLVVRLAEKMDLPQDHIDVEEPFIQFGLSSADGVELAVELEKWLGTSLPATLMWDYPTIEQVSRYLARDGAETQDTDEIGVAEDEPIAVIGVGCRFPQANGPDEFWNLLNEGRDAISTIPEDRPYLYEYFEDQGGEAEVPMWGGFLQGVDQFDADFFGITPREAASMDPQQRILLESVWEALEDGGIPPEQISGSNAGVFIGISTHDYSNLIDQSEINPYAGTGNAHSIAANRISYLLHLHGPSMAVDTACSSSLVSVHMACQSLRQGECRMAIAGGVNLILSPDLAINFTQAGVMAPDGRCKTFAEKANGYVRSEGVGAVILKPLSAAIEDGDPIYCVIRGSAVNQDGKSNGLMAPNGKAQEKVLKEAYRRAGIMPQDVKYIEAHGTGTALGDPIEVRALGEIIGKGRTPENPCLIGSVKTNIGHLEAAAGIAGLIKVVLAMKHGQIPASLHFDNPNPHIPFEELSFKVQNKLTPWPEGNKVAGVSSFGFGGTNAHLVLSEYDDISDDIPRLETKSSSHLLTLSAHQEKALKERVQSILTYLRENPDTSLEDVCYTANLKRQHYPYRLSLTAQTNDEVVKKLELALRDFDERKHCSSTAKLAFVFSGQGPQWVGMGLELYEQESVFREIVNRCDFYLRKKHSFALLEELRKDRSASRLDDFSPVTQPSLFVVQIALVELWKSWGVRPDAVIGHSLGEVAAAYTAGALSLEDAMDIVMARGRGMEKTVGTGKMLVVELNADEVKRILAEYEGKVFHAAVNSDTSHVLSGKTFALEEIAQKLNKEERFCRFLRVSFPSHSPLMQPILREYAEEIRHISSQPAEIPFYSTVSGGLLPGDRLDADYWTQNVCEPVMFAPAFGRMLDEGISGFIEISPHPALKKVLLEGVQTKAPDGFVLTSMLRDEDQREIMLDNLGELYEKGWTIDLSEVSVPGKLVSLPRYPWQRQSYWVHCRGSRQRRGDALIGEGMVSAHHSNLYHWEVEVDFEHHPYLLDHVVQGNVIVPGAFYIAQAFAAVQSLDSDQDYELRDVHFKEPLLLQKNQSCTMQIVFEKEEKGYSFFIYSFNSGNEEDHVDVPSLVHATGTLVMAEQSKVNMSLEQLKQENPHEVSVTEIYQRLAEEGLQYGEKFQGIRQLRKGDRSALGWIESKVTGSVGKRGGVHPAWFDVGLQVMSAALPEEEIQGVYLPVRIKEIMLKQPCVSRYWSQATVTSIEDESITGDLLFLNESGECVAMISGFVLQKVSDAKTPTWYYGLNWVEKELEESLNTANQKWLIFADEKGRGHEISSILEGYGCESILLNEGDVGLNGSEEDGFDGVFTKHINQVDQIVYMCGCHPEDEFPSMDQRQIDHCLRFVRFIRSLERQPWGKNPKVTVVTNRSQRVRDEQVCLPASLLWGLAGVVAGEHPDVPCLRVDWDDHPDHGEMLVRDLMTHHLEDQIAYREGRRYVARLDYKELERWKTEKVNTAEIPVTLEIENRGTLEGLVFAPLNREKPGPGEVEIEIYAAGLNFKDIISVMGFLPEQQEMVLGGECAGRIVRIGDGVEKWAVGDEVLAIAPNSFATHVVTGEDLIARKPPAMSYEEAATIPITFLTAYYSLIVAGRLREKEKVLIHSAAGGVGQAAIQLAKWLNCEIFATAGNEEKREFLRSMGVEHTMDSRTLSFANEILQKTDGAGVDLVLNSLSGEAIDKGIASLNSFGRFIEIGKIDLINNKKVGLEPFLKGLSYTCVDVNILSYEKPQIIGKMLKEIVELMEKGVLQPLPYTSYSLGDISDGFRHMATRKNIGKIVFRVRDQEVDMPPLSDDYDEGTFLVTGGLSGIGLAVAEHLADKGVKHLVLLARSKPKAEVTARIAQWAEQGVNVWVRQADVTDRVQLEKVFHEMHRNLPPLIGVIHSAGILDDSLLAHLDQERLERVLKPKAWGAWHLHELTKEIESVRFFVLFSSAATILGSPGQGNYAAANAFLDSLAHYRHAVGLPAQTINWGPWSHIGMVKESTKQGRISFKGIKSIPPKHGIRMFEEMVATNEKQVIVMNAEWNQLARSFYHPIPFLERVMEVWEPDSHRDSSSGLRADLSQASFIERKTLLVKFIRGQVARSLGIVDSRIESDRSLTSLGLDSLMAVEMKNRFEKSLDISFPIALFLKGLTIEELADELLGQMGLAEKETETEVPAIVANRNQNQKEFSLSYAQQSMWFMQQVSPDSSAYNIPSAMKIINRVDAEAMKSCFQSLLDRHSALRTTFPATKGVPCQYVHEQMEVDFEHHQVKDWETHEIIRLLREKAHTPFRLETDRLFRIVLLTRAEEEHYLLINVHHIIMDGWSLWKLISEFMELYQAKLENKDAGLPEISLTYTDYTDWQAKLLQSEFGQKMKSYWEETLRPVAEVLELETDYPRPPKQKFVGRSLFFQLSSKVSQRLKKFCESEGITPYVFLMTCYQLMLYRGSHQTSFVIGSPSANRSTGELEEIVGNLVNMMPIQAKIGKTDSLMDLLSQVKMNVLHAFENQEYPMPLIVKDLRLPRDPSRSPLFQAVFTWQKSQIRELHDQGLTAFALGTGGLRSEHPLFTVETVNLEREVSMFDLTLTMAENEDQIEGTMQYDVNLFKEETVATFISRFQQIAEQILDDPQQEVVQLMTD